MFPGRKYKPPENIIEFFFQLYFDASVILSRFIFLRLILLSLTFQKDLSKD